MADAQSSERRGFKLILADRIAIALVPLVALLSFAAVLFGVTEGGGNPIPIGEEFLDVFAGGLIPAVLIWAILRFVDCVATGRIRLYRS